MDSWLRTAVTEYLRFYEYTGTLACFDSEHDRVDSLSTSKAAKAASEENVRSNFSTAHLLVKEQMLNAFDNGEGDLVGRLWEKHIDGKFLGEDARQIQRLEFYVHVHCALLPTRGGRILINDLSASMKHFKKFLETRGKALAADSEFLAYYALPYVPEPQKHPSFDLVFKPGWVKNMRNQLESFLASVLDKVEVPDLCRLYAKHYAQGGDGGPMAQANNQEREERLRTAFLTREQKMKQFIESMYNISVELLRQSERGGPMDSNLFLFAKERLMFFGSVINSESWGRSSNAQHETSYPSIKSIPENAVLEKTQQPILPAIDYQKVSLDLGEWANVRKQPVGASEIEAAERNCCLVLQALRWRISRSIGAKAKRRVVEAYIEGDVLGLKSPESESTPENSALVETLLSSSEIVKEYALRFINWMASDSKGRSYLLGYAPMIDLLVSTLQDEPKDTKARQNALGALQKFSLRKMPQTKMIQLDLIAWIVRILRDHTLKSLEAGDGERLLSEYTVEYSSALLMNLALRTAGKEKAEQEANGDILLVLNDLIESDNVQVRTYVNGTLYSILTRPRLKEKAMSMGMDEVLKGLMAQDNCSDQFRAQFEYILKQLASEEKSNEDDNDEESKSDDEEDDDDDDDIDEEEEEDAPLEPDEEEQSSLRAGKVEDGELAGEALLVDRYLANDGDARTAAREAKIIEGNIDDATQKSAANNSRERETDDSKPLQRPVTPAHDVPEEFKPAPRVIRTPQLGATRPVNDPFYNYHGVHVSPRELESKGEEPISEEADGGDEYEEAFGRRSKLIRTPLTSAMAYPGEFGDAAYE